VVNDSHCWWFIACMKTTRKTITCLTTIQKWWTNPFQKDIKAFGEQAWAYSDQAYCPTLGHPKIPKPSKRPRFRSTTVPQSERPLFGRNVEFPTRVFWGFDLSQAKQSILHSQKVAAKICRGKGSWIMTGDRWLQSLHNYKLWFYSHHL